MSITIYVIDTSYLIEIAGGGRDSNAVASAEVRKRFSNAVRQGGRFFVPLPCLFELGDHIADIKHEARRAELVAWLRQTVQNCLDNCTPWTITPTAQPTEILPQLLEEYGVLSVRNQIGMVDAFTASEARRLKARFAKSKGLVHIWTNDEPLKRCEPDSEAEPYLWESNGTPRFFRKKRASKRKGR